MSVQLNLFSRKTFKDTSSVISSPVSAAGHTPSVSPGGLQMSLFGPARFRASPSRSRASGKVLLTNGTYGPTLSDSSAPAVHQSSSENKSLEHSSQWTPKGKICVACKEHKPYNCYYADKKGRTQNLCIECWKTREKHRKAGTKVARSEIHRKWRRNNRTQTLISAAKYRARQRSLPFDLDDWKPQLEERINRGVCELTGLPLNLDGGRTWDSPSLDRIYPEDGYTITNIRVVLFSVNTMMNAWGEEKVLEIAEAMREKMIGAEKELLADWEANLKRRLSRYGSMEYALTWKKRVTPAGRSISRLVPSTRRTNGTGYSGWPTPNTPSGGPNVKSTATHTGGMDLDGAVQVCGWPTASARDWRSGKASAETMERNSRQLNEVAAQLAGWTTPQAHDTAPGNPARLGRHGTTHGDRNLNDEAAQLAGWGTPRVTTNSGIPCPEHTGKGSRLEDQAAQLAGWQTPSVEDAGRTGSAEGYQEYLDGHRTTQCRLRNQVQAAELTGWKTPLVPSGGRRNPPGTTLQGRRPDGKKVTVDLREEVETVLAGWSTPNSQDGGSEETHRGVGTRVKLLGQALVSGTPTPSPDPIRKENSGGSGALNPEFVAWLMMGDLWPKIMACAPDTKPSRSSRKANQ